MSDQEDFIELASPDQVVGVVPWSGGGIAYWRRRRGETWCDLLRPATTQALDRDGPLALGCFPLVPYSNRIRDGRFHFGAEEIRLPLNFGDHPHSIHGHGWQAPWQIAARDDARIILGYRHDADEWPFTYEAKQSIALDDHGISLVLTLTNRADRPMPAGLGFHPYFTGAASARLTAEVDGVWLTDEKALPTEWRGLPPHWNLPAGAKVADMGADNLFTNWQGEAVITRVDPGFRLCLRAGAPLRHLVIYAPAGEDYFCVEPVSHLTDAVNLAASGMAGTGLEVLAPGESLEAAMRIDVNDA